MTEPLQTAQTEQDNTLALIADRRQFPQLEAWLEEVLLRVGMSQKSILQMMIVADEVFTNIASYAYPGQEQPGMVEVSWQVDASQNVLKLCFCDSGVPFDPQAYVPVAPSFPQKGGKGIFLVRKFVDAMEYRRENDRNILTLTKSLG